MLAFAVLGVITTEVAPIGLLPDVVEAFGVDEAAAGMLVTLYAALVAVTAVPLTRATRRIARKPLLLGTLAIFTASNVLAAAAPTFEILVVSRAVGGLAHALFFAVVIGYAARIAPAGQTGRAIALVATGTSAGLVFGVPAGTAVADLLGWRTTFAALGILVGVATALTIVILQPVEHDPAAGKKLVPGGATMLLIAALAATCFFGYYMLYTYVSPMLLAAGLDKFWLSAMLVALGLSGLIGIRLVAPLLDHRPYTFLVIVPASIIVSQVALALVFPEFWPVVIVATIWTAAFGPVNSTYQNILVRAGREGPEMAGAWINAFCNVGIGAGGALGGIYVTGTIGYPGAGLIGTGVIALALAATLIFRRRLMAVASD